MVVVLGSPTVRPGTGPGPRVAGLAAGIAMAAAGAGARVELVGKVGDDGGGDAVAVELQRAGVGHAALLRDPAVATPVGERATPLPLERPDLELALRYLVDFGVLVVADPLARPVAEVVAEAAGYAGAHRILIGGDPGVSTEASEEASEQASTEASAAASHAPDGESVTHLRAGAGDRHAFAALVGRYAAFLDAGQDPGGAFARAAGEVGWEAAHHG